MTDLKELRLAIKGKLEHRRALLKENAGLRGKVSSVERERDLALRVSKSRVMNFVLEDCADQIVEEILRRALEASEVVAREAYGHEGAMIEVGIDIPSLHIRHCVMDFETFPRFGDKLLPVDTPVRRINVGTPRERYGAGSPSLSNGGA